ncbi:MAG TPA: hypothetical protein DIV86_02125 [Alphaproteobacteria bacterium]|nr:hypothetical protein [Alphaproteobacteria bacterium]
MPQISQIDSFLSQIFWFFLAFGIIYYFVLKIMSPKVSSVIAERENIITSDIAAAENMRGEAAKTTSDLEKALAKSRSVSQKIISDAEKSAKDNYNSQIKDVEQKFKADFQNTENEIISAKKKAIEQLNKDAVSFVEQILNKLAGLNIKKEVIEKVLTNK